MNARNSHIGYRTGLICLLVLSGAACEPNGWFPRDLGAPTPPAETEAEAESAVEEVQAQVEEAAIKDLSTVEAELRSIAESAQEIQEEPAPDPTPEAEPEPAEEADDYRGGPSAELLAILNDPALQDDVDGRMYVALAREMAALRGDVERLRQQLDSQLGTFVRDLKTENARLRREVQRLYTLQGKSGGPLPILPGGESYSGEQGALYGDSGGGAWPGEVGAASETTDLAANDLAGGDTAGPERATGESNGPVALVGSSSSEYAVIVEWGRSPDEALNVGPDVSSLRGMIVLVPKGTPAGSLAALGRQLHDEYADYDNINIKVFDDRDAADLYAKTNSSEKGGPVMHISKFAARDEDRITLYRGDEAVDIPINPQ